MYVHVEIEDSAEYSLILKYGVLLRFCFGAIWTN